MNNIDFFPYKYSPLNLITIRLLLFLKTRIYFINLILIFRSIIQFILMMYVYKYIHEHVYSLNVTVDRFPR